MVKFEIPGPEDASALELIFADTKDLIQYSIKELQLILLKFFNDYEIQHYKYDLREKIEKL